MMGNLSQSNWIAMPIVSKNCPKRKKTVIKKSSNGSKYYVSSQAANVIGVLLTIQSHHYSNFI